ncbi:MAG: hypothetical protein V7740_05450 [Pseudomonas marincola]
MFKKLGPATVTLLKESSIVYWGLLKIIVPVMILVEIGIRAGLIDVMSEWSGPFMDLFGLPAEVSLILATNLLVGIYPSIIILIALAPDIAFTTADMTVMGGMLLFGHALPIEQLIVKRTGTSLIFSCFTRFLAMLIYGILCHQIISIFGLFEEPANILIALDVDNIDKSWLGWAISSAQSLFVIFWILTGLIALLKTLEFVGITRWLMKALTPVLKLIGIGPNAAPLAMVGILLGLSFGGGLIMREVDKGTLNPRSVFISMIFLGICHGLIEDTIVVMAIGGHWSGVFVGRIALSILLIIPLSYGVKRMSDKTFRLLYK